MTSVQNSRNFSRFFVSFLVFAMMAVFNFTMTTQQANAQSTQEIAIVDIQGLLQKSKAAVSVQKQLKDQRKSFQAEFSKYEDKLKAAEKELAGQRAKLSAEEFNKKRKEFEKQLLETRSLVQSRKSALDAALKEAMGKLRVEIIKIVADIAEEKDYKLVMSRQNVIIVDKNIDITQDVLAKLDKSLKKIPLNVKKS